ncbi:Txe/YoeB family addiction module toxin [Endozoicomonas ascidiicola]|uniref:Txe/YoeB family addiction module toxin n=1 Tax=Endozoicomonas ascidiicola TaxID=1698521 RepID=UPI000833781C|nr:Txe/YoeB family addiction module toxin [Endozoicomonas ascidiicola]
MSDSQRLLCWSQKAWGDYLYWQQQDKKYLKRINKLITETLREPFSRTGKPKPLKGNWQGYWSKRISEKHRLIYQATDKQLTIAVYRFHY